MKNIIKIIAINIIIFFALIGILVFVPILTYQTYSYFKSSKIPPKKFYDYPNKEFSKEIVNLKFTYSDFTTIKTNQFNGKAININNDGNRVTKISKNVILNSPSYIFLGSSMIWGYGDEDGNTIPSIFSQFNNVYIDNFAEVAYTTKQSLGKLITYYSENKLSNNKRVIIFAVGDIDFATNCSDDEEIFKSSHTKKLQKIIESSFNVKYNEYLDFKLIFEPTLLFFKKLVNKPQSNNIGIKECSKKKLNFISDTMIKNLSIANQIAKYNGDNFFAVLSPVSYEDDIDVTNYNTQKDKDIIKFNAKNGYEIIRKKIKENSEFNFIDLSKIFTNNSDVYYDPSHYSLKGKKIYVEELTKEINNLKKLENR
ncbi:MAG: hypothetical protein U5K55_07065 [Aliarcobacter sp.]|nr:hypothetical protein [Aliarcobacter sp.]